MGSRPRRRSSDLVDVIVDQWHQEIPSLDVDSIKVLGRLHRCDVRYQGMVGDVVGEFGLSTATFDVLASLRRSGPDHRRTAGQLAETGLISTGGLTQRIDRLEKAGLVERSKQVGDRRVVYIQLTAAGMELIDTVIQRHFDEQNHMLASLTASERRQLTQLLARLEFTLEIAEQRYEQADEVDAG